MKAYARFKETATPTPFPAVADEGDGGQVNVCILCGERDPDIRGAVMPRSPEQAARFGVKFGQGLFFTACSAHRLDLDATRLEIESRLAYVMQRRTESLAAGVR